MKVFNTLTRQKEELKTIEPGKVRIYACGPTVYNFIHIGNARPICVFDVLRRYLEYRGYEVNFVQNFTDIDDKMIRRANEEGVTVSDIAEKYIRKTLPDSMSALQRSIPRQRKTSTLSFILFSSWWTKDMLTRKMETSISVRPNLQNTGNSPISLWRISKLELALT